MNVKKNQLNMHGVLLQFQCCAENFGPSGILSAEGQYMPFIIKRETKMNNLTAKISGGVSKLGHFLPLKIHISGP
jgi:hypothetical protein